MTASYLSLPLDCLPGIQRDGTELDSLTYIDGMNCRFVNGRPKKIGGWKLIDRGEDTPIRSLAYVPRSTYANVYLGQPNKLRVIALYDSGLTSFVADRTPAEFAIDTANTWMFEVMTLPNSDERYIIAHAAPNNVYVNSPVETPIYYGPVAASTPLEPLNETPAACSGGIVLVGPYLFKYGNGLQWSTAGDPTTFPDENSYFPSSGSKVLKGVSTWGNTGPNALFWTQTELIRAYFSGGEFDFGFVPLSKNVSLLSPSSVVEYNNQFFWVGQNAFYYYNGIIQELPNTFNKDWFFENLNKNAQAKVWGYFNPRYSEVVFCFPFGDSAECNHQVVYNVKDKVWYDTPMARMAGLSSNLFPYPLLSDSFTISYPETQDGGETFTYVNRYGLWLHEYGVDEITLTQSLAIPSSFETKIFSLRDLGAPDTNMMTYRLEPDARQSAPMAVQIRTRGFARGDTTLSSPYGFSPNSPYVDMQSIGRLVSFRFESNTAGGDYWMGKTFIAYRPGDAKGAPTR